jgi:hypothetical protein
MSDAERLEAEWLKRVLAIELGNASNAGPEAPSLRRLAICRLDWLETCSTIRRQVDALQASIVDCYEQVQGIDPATLSEVTAAVEELNTMISEIDDTLSDVLDEVINQPPGTARAAVIAKATKLTDAYQRLVESDPDFALIDDNEFYQTGLKSMTRAVLVRISSELQSVAQA